MNPTPFIAITDSPDTDNIPFQKAATFVCETDENIFLTGKAGSGKTTFLKYIRTQTKKKCVVVAPTGIAAINAGGETIHSFLQLPMSPYIPGNAGGFGTQPENAVDKHGLLARLRFRDTKLQLLKKLELLIIDEVSMVRADLLDAMDVVLRHVRKKYDQPFGGVQVLFIGDLFQLPPVAREEDWEVLRRYYPGTYFFYAHVMQQFPPLYIELTKVYRQKDQVFINLLNRIRTGLVTQQDIDVLNKLHNTENKKGYIILSTHNQIADTINQEALAELPTPVHTFEGKVVNDFNIKSVTVELKLELKEGAQVMFIKNDLQSPRRYFNGKLAIIKSITPEGIKVTFPSEPKTDPMFVPLETWRNLRYSFDAVKGEIKEDELGSFQQYPLRLAWAITVHKSQGLTLENAIVDLNRSFASGQVYVALSRCTSMEGLILRSKLNIDNVLVDERIIDFAETATDEAELDARLDVCRKRAYVNRLTNIFSFSDTVATTELHRQNLEKRKGGPAELNRELAESILETLKQTQKHAEGFHRQLQAFFNAGDHHLIQERAKAATQYFAGKVLTPAIASVDAILKKMEGNTKAIKQVKLWRSYKIVLEQKVKELHSFD